MIDKTPPQSIDSEMAVLGAMLMNREAIQKAMEILKPEDFYKTANKTIFQSIISLFNKNSPVDIVTLSGQLQVENELVAVGGNSYLCILPDSAPSSTNIECYAKIVHDMALLRQLINVGVKISALGYSCDTGVEQVVIEAEQLILDVMSNTASSKKYQTTKDGTNMLDHIDQLEKKYLAGGQVQGIMTGYYDIDYLLGGMQRQEVTVIAACTSMGKSTLAVNIAVNNIKKGIPVGMIVLESSQYRLYNRLIAMDTNINSMDIATGRISKDDWGTVVQAAGQYADSYAPLCTIAKGGLDLATITAVSLKMKREHGIELLIIDHIGRIIPPKKQSREQEVAAISNHIDNLAKQLDIPIIAVSQLNRAVGARAEKRPVLSDLRDSGTIEQDAANVILIYRDNYYNTKSEKGNITEIIVPKTRDGRVGMAEVLFIPECLKFANLSDRSC